MTEHEFLERINIVANRMKLEILYSYKSYTGSTCHIGKTTLIKLISNNDIKFEKRNMIMLNSLWENVLKMESYD